MLGYDLQDINHMCQSIELARRTVDKTSIIDGLNKAEDFLQGMWAEGYFDGYED
jgi:hypothetical protein